MWNDEFESSNERVNGGFQFAIGCVHDSKTLGQNFAVLVPYQVQHPVPETHRQKLGQTACLDDFQHVILLGKFADAVQDGVLNGQD